ncbi:MAG: hypothetical protein ACKN9T_03485 [Candidatus Methylumidiphilus sp.]
MAEQNPEPEPVGSHGTQPGIAVKPGHQRVRILAPSRLHFGLVGMSSESVRAFGGMGVSIWHHFTEVVAERNPAGIAVFGTEPHEELRITKALAELSCDQVAIRVVNRPPRHYGFGSGTSLLLSCLEAAMLIRSGTVARQEIVRASCRGGASGVGLSTYFSGGVVGDWGHRSAVREFTPSGATVQSFVPPPRAFALKWPSTWPLVVAYPSDHLGFSGDEELKFMQANTPIPLQQSALAALSLLFETPASIQARDFAGFRDALRRSTETGFKARELERVEHVARVVKNLREFNTAAATMSSFGPVLAIAAETSRSMSEVLASGAIPSNWVAIKGRAASTGRKIFVY